MAQHLRNRLAREGLLVRPQSILTFSRFSSSLVPGLDLVSAADLPLLVAEVLERRKPRALAELADSPGLAKAIASAFEDLSNNGCDALQWQALRSFRLVRGPIPDSLGDLYSDLETLLAERKLCLRSDQLTRAASAVASAARSWGPVYFDGFFQFSPVELRFVEAVANAATLTIALPEWPGVQATREALLRGGAKEERMKPVRCAPKRTLVAPVSREAEALEIARRILAERNGGRAWREMGVILRSAGTMSSLLEDTFDRLGIPHRAYFTEELSSHPLGRFLIGALDALLSGWPAEATLAVIRIPVTRAGISSAADELERVVKEQSFGAGLDRLRMQAVAIRNSAELVALIGRLGQLNSWLAEPREPAQWAACIAGLVHLVHGPGPAKRASADAERAWRSRSEAARAITDALSSAARLMDPAPVALEGFWAQAKPALEGSALRPSDPRRDVVHVMDVYEARQWELPVVFLCGLLEGEFPRHAQPDPILGEDVRLRLNQRGITVPTRRSRESEEDFLFEFARTRATESLVFSYPLSNEKGDPNLPAFALTALELQPEAVPRAKVKSGREPGIPPAPAIGSLDTSDFSPSAIESYLQCPFQFYARYTLKLQGPPKSAGEDLDFLIAGNVLHETAARWHRSPESPIEPIFEGVWDAALAEERIPESYRTEVVHAALLRSLREYVTSARLAPGWTVVTERTVSWGKAGVTVRGRVDRIDSNESKECRVVDLKYSGSHGARERKEGHEAGTLVQGGLYLLALEQEGYKPISFHYCATRGEINWQGWDDPAELRSIMTAAEENTLRVAAEIRNGRIVPQPADPGKCGFCDFRDACRSASGEMALEASGE
jgi:ATP-dependent helicase/DNAse subunit B